MKVMPQEPRSFFERLTGARMMSSNNVHEEADHPAVVQDYDDSVGSDVRLADEALAEEEIEGEENYSDETAGHVDDEEQEGQLTVDVFQDDENIVIQSTIAGVAPDDLDVSITNDMVTIRGERRQPYEVDHEDYFYQECYWGTFSRSIILPVEIDSDRAEAKIKNGVLTIRIPKANAAMTRKLKVKAT
jgi:HSP20 family molecular chaperone IbpA